MTQDDRKKNLKTICAPAAAALVLALLTRSWWPLIVALGLLAAGLLSAKLAALLAAAWLAFGEALGNFNSKIILTLIYWLVLTPTALLYRAVKKDPLGLARQDGGSYFHDRAHTFTKGDLENGW